MTGASCFTNNGLLINRWTNAPKNISYKNDLLITVKGTIGELAFNNIGEVHIARQIMALTINEKIEQKFIFYFLLVNKERMIQKNASLIPGIKRDDILNLEIALPPKEEQKRIITKIDELLYFVKKIRNELKAMRDLSIAVKRKILDFFFGENSSYKSYYNDKYNTTLKRMIPKNKIGDGDWVLTSDMDENGEYSLVQLKHICEGKYNKEKKYNHINSMFFKNNNCSEIKENYILINRLIMSSMNVCILPKLGFKTITSVDVCWIAPDNSYNQKYLMYYLLSSSFQNQVLNKSSGSTRKRISKKNLINIPMRIHNIKDQEIIVKKIDAMFEILNLIIS